VSDESSKVVDELAGASPAEEPVEETVAQSQPEPDAPQAHEDPVASAETAASAETVDSTETVDSAETVAEQVDSKEADSEGERVEKPTSFAPMTVDDLPTQKEVKPASDESIEMDWYILKVQSNRERSIADALRRKVAIEGLDSFFGDVVVPTEKVTEFKGGKKKVVERKLYPGYIVVHMHINDDTWFAVRETSGIGDFTGSGGKPTPMLPHEVSRIVQTEEEEDSESPKLNINFAIGDQVKIKDGTFESFEGEVSTIDEQSGRITVMINIFGRSTPVELEYWQVETM
jgi:transcriptional antiterminator NusG